jgi:hypothetical protein
MAIMGRSGSPVASSLAPARGLGADLVSGAASDSAGMDLAGADLVAADLWGVELSAERLAAGSRDVQLTVVRLAVSLAEPVDLRVERAEARRLRHAVDLAAAEPVADSAVAVVMPEAAVATVVVDTGKSGGIRSFPQIPAESPTGPSASADGLLCLWRARLAFSWFLECWVVLSHPCTNLMGDPDRYTNRENALAAKTRDGCPGGLAGGWNGAWARLGER